MAEEALREVIDSMRARIQAELDAQIQSLTSRHDEAVARARQEAEAEVEKRWASKADAIRSEWSARLQAEVATARDAAEERLIAESMRVRTEAEQALAAERQRAAADLDAERSRAEQELQQLLAALDAERQQLERESHADQSADVDPTKVLGAARAIGDARSLSEALTNLVRGAAAHAPRVALFVVNGARLDEWPVDGISQLSHGPLRLDETGLLRTAVVRGTIVFAKPGVSDHTPPAFASISSGGAAFAAPLLVGGEAVAVLYADGGLSGTGKSEDAWTGAVELLARHAASCVAHLTAVRALKVLQSANGRTDDQDLPAPPDDERSARRYAKLLISEIKLYNEGAVRVGCEKRDLLRRLQAEIDRARRLYEERVPSSVTERGTYFQQELIHTLAGGEISALGPEAR